MKYFAIATLGCKVNTYESQSYIEALQEKGFQEVDFKEVADIYIINTCSVTNNAASKSRQKIHAAKKNNPDALICVVGCFVQTTIDKEALQADILIGSSQKHRLSEYIVNALENKHDIDAVETYEAISNFEDVSVHAFAHQTRAFLKIQDGCNQFCSYCIIPYARGKERSLHPQKVIAAAKKLVASNHKEIVLTGIHSGRYGLDVASSLLALLKDLCCIDGLERIRISSIEISEISDAFIAFIKDNPKVGRNLHIPLQSGSDTILNAMNRPYTVKTFKDRVAYIRSQIPDISISSDIILGFPGEDDCLYEETKQCILDINFSFLHVFPYSKRDGTKAALFLDPIPNNIKKRRCKEISEIAKQLHQNYRKSWIKREVVVLYEYVKDGYLHGHTNEYEMVVKKGSQTQCNQFVKEVVSDYNDQHLIIDEK
ncbi:MAG: tRNA (N(6)-L-threonylcarbamoyladenosine(37)-C(2))-methylthiotransferase MtaB [Breznakia sp.]